MSKLAVRRTTAPRSARRCAESPHAKIPLNTPRRSLASLLRFRALQSYAVDAVDQFERGQGPAVPPDAGPDANHAVHWAGWHLPEAVERCLREVERGARVATIEVAEELANLLQNSPSFLAFGDPVPPWKPTRRSRSAGMPARLQRARRRCGLSAQRLGSVAGLSAARILQAEAGRIAAGLDLIEALASALNVSPGWLAYGEGPRPFVSSKDR